MTKLNVYNFSQTSLNSYYNLSPACEYKNGISGTCVEVAITMLMEYMARKDKISNENYESKYTIFKMVVQEAKSLGWDGSGTLVSMIDNIMNASFENYTPVYSANHSTSKLLSKLETTITAGIPAVVNLKGHSVTGVGIVFVEVEYTKKNVFGVSTTKTANEVFVVINNGWYDSSVGEYQYSYVPIDEVKSIEVPER